MERMSAEQLAEEMSRFVNSFSAEDRMMDLAEKLASDHRTLQQNHFRFAMMIIEVFANKKYTDGRNEASVKMAKIFMKAFKEELGYDEDDKVENIHTYLPHVQRIAVRGYNENYNPYRAISSKIRARESVNNEK